MCGIAGIVGLRRPMLDLSIRRMTDSLVHRGPDDSGVFLGQFGSLEIGLGHRRLSVIDLSPSGHQPMVDPSTGSVLVYNGELYNYRALKQQLEACGIVFRGTSDTEVLLQALCRWGTDCISRFEGMFAFAFLDRQQDRMVLARDPLGIKPLYFVSRPDGLLFASEVRALAVSGCVDPALDRNGLAGFLSFGAFQSPVTLFRDVHEFPAGSWQAYHVDSGQLHAGRPVSFWKCPDPTASIEHDDLVSRIRQACDGAVHSHLVADVPVGVFLSSGLDSTLVATLATRHASRVRTFTVGYDEDPRHTEHAAAEETARRLGTSHQTIMVSRRSAEESVSSWFKAIDLPSIDGLNVYVISKVVREAGLTVALSGQGGDELFGGYPLFADIPHLAAWARRLGWIPSSLRRSIFSRLPTGSRPARDKIARMLASDGDIERMYFLRRSVLSDRQLAGLGVSKDEMLVSLYGNRDDGRWPTLCRKDPVAQVSMLESRYYLGNMLLRDSDLFGMAHGLEIRVPLLDLPLINLAYSVPGSQRLPTGRADKHLLREAFGDIYTAQTLACPKRGFLLPVGAWMRTTLRDQCEAALQELKVSGWVDPAGVDSVWQGFLGDSCSDGWSRAWALCVLGNYHMQIKDRFYQKTDMEP